jgi:hypothetical protein
MRSAEVDVLEDCLERLQAGASLEQILELYPQWASELRPLLESALLAWSLRVSAPIPEASMARSRTLFVNKAVAQPQTRPFIGLVIRFSHSLVAALAAVVILAIGTSFVSAQSLPGDIFYPVKLAGEQTRLLLTTNTTQRLNLQETYDEKRANEVEDLLQVHRQVEVTFVGLLTNTLDNHWQVAGVNVVFPAELNSTFGQMLNSYVEVTGLSQSDGLVQVSEIHLRELDFSGTVSSITAGMWIINQVSVRVDSETQINGAPSVGAHVSVKAYRQEDSTLKARLITVIDSGKQEAQIPSATSQSDGSQVESTGDEIGVTATDSQGNLVLDPTITLENTSTNTSEGPTPTVASSPVSGIGGVGNEHITPTQTSSPTRTPTADSTSTTSATNTRTPKPSATATSTPTQNKDGETQPVKNGSKTPTPTPTPRGDGSGRGG